MNNKELAHDVLRLVGGKENVISVVHCATRLRFKLADETKADTEALNNHTGVIKVVQSGGQYQVVIGSHVSEVYPYINEGNKDQTVSEAVSEKKGVLNTAIDTISSIFTPFLGVIAGSGILKGLLNLALALGWLTNQDTAYQLLYTAADGIFYFMPMALAITAARKFKTNEFLALALAMALLYPGFTSFAASVDAAGGSLTFLGLPVIYSAAIGGYTSTVIPIIMAVWVQSYVERFAKKVVPNIIKIFGVTALTLIIMVPLTYILIGPIGLVLGQVIGGVFKGLYAFNPILAGLVLGGLWQVLVMFGMHWGLVPIALSNLAMNGMDFMIPMSLAGVLAQSGAALGVLIASKDVKLKGLAGSGVITALFGITEPTVYGVTLPLKKPFIFACIGGAIGGAIVAANNVLAYAFGQSILTLPSMIDSSGDTSKMMIAVVAYAVAFLFAALMTVFFGMPKDSKKKV